MQNFNFTPVVSKNSIFKKLPLVFMYVGHNKNVHIHLYEGLINLGFTHTVKVNFMIDNENKKVFMFPHKDEGQSITKITDDHCSIKCPVEFKDLDLQPLQPIKKGTNSSGKYLICEPIKYLGFNGVIIDIRQFYKKQSLEET